MKAEQILSQIMKEDVNNSSAECIAATSITFDAVIHGWAKRGNREGAKRAEDILEQMETLRKSGNLRVCNRNICMEAYWWSRFCKTCSVYP